MDDDISAAVAERMKRQDPIPEQSSDEKTAWVRAIVDIFGLAFVRGHGDHPIQQLWKRSDWLATTELFWLGAAVSGIVSRQPGTGPRILRELTDRDPANQQAAAWEYVSCAMMNTKRSSTRLAPAGQKTWDFSLQAPGGPEVRVSCKRLTASLPERNFRAFAHGARAALIAGLDGRRNVSALVLDENASPGTVKVDRIKRNLTKAVSTFKGAAVTVPHHGCATSVGPLSSLTEYPFLPNESSWTLLVTRPMSEQEQKRLGRTVEKAMSQVESESNVIPYLVMVQITPFVDTADASRWLKDLFVQTRPKLLAGVVLYRNAVGGSARPGDTSSERAIVHDVVYVHNDFADPAVKEAVSSVMPFAMEVPIGHVGTTSTKLMLGGAAIPVDDHYVYVRGEHVYINHLKNGEGSTTLPQPPNILVDVVIAGMRLAGDRNWIRLAAKRPPVDELVLL